MAELLPAMEPPPLVLRFPMGRLHSGAARRCIAAFATEDSSGDDGGGGREAVGRAQTAGPSLPSTEPRRRRGKLATQRPRGPSVREVERLIGVADEEDGGGSTWAEDGSRRSPVLDFWASTPIGQAESAPEKKLREVGEWLVERTESQPLIGQRILMTVCLYILPVWVVLLLLASGAITLPFDVPFLDDLLS